MLTHKQTIFLSSQFLLWLGIAIITRFVWIAAIPPTWAWISIYVLLGFIFSSLLYLIYKRIIDSSILKQVTTVIVCSVLLGLGWRVIFNIVEYHILESANNQFKFWGYFHNGKSAVTQLLVWSGGFWALHYYHQYLNQQQQTRQAKLEAESATLKMLEYQLNPHFLFNVLASMDTLLLKEDSYQARKMLERLTDFLRSSLEHQPQIAVTLQKEIQRIIDYLAIEQFRFGNRIRVSWNVPDELPTINVPNGILLPLVENALKHGKIATSTGGELNVNLYTEGQYCYLSLENECCNGRSEQGFGIGLSNTRQRLERYYRGHAKLEIESKDNKFRVLLKLPLKHRVNDEL